ncbi:MAG TPA: sterol desaturase family protein [Stellaceae bacterium]|nr:sterol desaturase family protein [Stellaceae bacterium]
MEEAPLALIVIFGSLLVVAGWEFSRPRRRREFPALRRRIGNLGFWVLNLFLAAFFFPQATSIRPHIEALSGISFPTWPIADAGVSLVAGFLLLDLMRYAVHRCEHAVPLFWRFHALHHSDPDVDVTTAVRHHPVEYLVASVVYWLAVLVLDFPPLVVLTHGLAVFATAAIQHGNIRLPERLERRLQPALVTIDMHRIHHSVSFAQANSNYGAVLSVWDRLFGTYTSITPAQHERLVFGVRELARRDCLKPSLMMLTPLLLSRARVANGPGGDNSRRPASVTRTAIPRGRRRGRGAG